MHGKKNKGYEEDLLLGKKLVNQYLQSDSDICYFDSDEFVCMVCFCLSQNNSSLAHKLIDIALRVHPNELELQIKNAEIYAYEQLYDSSIKILNNCIEPNNWETLYSKGVTYLEMRKYGEAIDTFDKIITQSNNIPEWTSVIYDIANSFDIENDDELRYAIKYIKMSYDCNPKDKNRIESYVLYANRMGDYEKAIQLINKMIDIDVYDAFSWERLAFMQLNVGRPEDALDSIKYALMIDNSNVYSYQIEANCLEKLERYNEVIDVYKKIKELSNSEDINQEINISIAEAYFYLGKHEDALKYYNQVFAIKKNEDVVNIDDIDSLANYLTCIIKNDDEKNLDLDIAICNSIIKKVIKIYPNDAKIWYLYAECHSLLWDLNEAIKGYRKVLKLTNKHNSVVLKKLAAAYLYSGEYDKTIKICKDTLKSCNKEDKKYLSIMLSNAYLAKNDVPRAMEYYLFIHDFNKEEKKRLFIELAPDEKLAKDFLDKIYR